MLDRYVSEILNLCSLASINDLFAASFEDHDPFCLLPIYDGGRFASGTREDVHFFVQFLASDNVDIAFSIERAVGDGECVGYRMFGEGYIRTLSLATRGPKVPPASTSFTVGNFGEIPSSAPMEHLFRQLTNEPHRVLGDRVHLEISCVGMFHVRNNKFASRYGPWLLR